MVKVTIIGWYGTETIGDRAILSGILRILKSSLGDFSISLGSLFPILSERTLMEDCSFYTECINSSNLAISIFNSLSSKELARKIKESDFLIVGGGPLMDMSVMYMLEYAFDVARKYHVKTALIGCGWGPLKSKEYINCSLRLIKKANLTIFRDQISLELYSQLCSTQENVYSSIDPAFFAAQYYENKISGITRSNEYITVNFRDISLDSYEGNAIEFEGKCIQTLQELLDSSSKDILLIPMHTFFIGGDDRDILIRIAKKIKNDRISIMQNPLNLEDTMNKYYNSEICLGMRFHAIVLQTILNGKNYIMDYTNPQYGKIKGVLNTLNISDLYQKRYISLFDEKTCFDFSEECVRYQCNGGILDNFLNTYIKQIKNIF